MSTKVLNKSTKIGQKLYCRRPFFSLFGLKINKNSNKTKIDLALKNKEIIKNKKSFSTKKNKNSIKNKKTSTKLIPAPISNCAPPPPPLPTSFKSTKPSTKSENNQIGMYPKLVDQITGGLAKVVQKATDAYVFQDLPECGVLTHTERLSMKLLDPQVHRCLLQLPAWRPEPDRLESNNFFNSR
uniref:Uncharacterized protein n=1 Tax=Meloidogyne enterolobii TaxID=390850 RepID=A0A6V7VZ57_MELEN|nr:unnamed protein product [Meloidogyne enterolobii]